MKKLKGNAAKKALALAKKMNVPNTMEMLEEELKNLKAVTDKPYLTTGNLDGFGDIKTETKAENLIRAFSMVRGKEDSYMSAAKELGFKSYPAFTISGGNAEQWKQDIQLRKNVIFHDERKKKLQSFKDKMAEFMSKEDQYQMLMKEMATFLGKDPAKELEEQPLNID